MNPILESGLLWRSVIDRFEAKVKGQTLTAWGYSAKGVCVVFKSDGSVEVATETRPGILNMRMVCFANAVDTGTPRA